MGKKTKLCEGNLIEETKLNEWNNVNCCVRNRDNEIVIRSRFMLNSLFQCVTIYNN